MKKSLLLMVLALLVGFEGVAQAQCLSASACRGRYTVEGRKLPFYRTHRIKGPHAAVRHAVIMVHGRNRTADDAFDDTIEAARRFTGRDVLSDTAIFSPEFQASGAGDEWSWSSDTWSAGGLSDQGQGVASFDMIDNIIQRIGDPSNYPNLESIVVAGHSAGGQFVHRYMGTNRADADGQDGITIRYVVANPSTYLYSTPERFDYVRSRWTSSSWSFNDSKDFVGKCPEWNEYRYGLDDLWHYPGRIGASWIYWNIRARSERLIVLAGSADTGAAALDPSCGAMAQGRERFERAALYALHHAREHGVNVLTVVPGVGHDNGAMFQSAQGRVALFDM